MMGKKWLFFIGRMQVLPSCSKIELCLGSLFTTSLHWLNSEAVQYCPENHASFEFERRRKMEVTSGRLCKAEKPTTTALLYHTTLAYFVH